MKNLINLEHLPKQDGSSFMGKANSGYGRDRSRSSECRRREEERRRKRELKSLYC